MLRFPVLIHLEIWVSVILCDKANKLRNKQMKTILSSEHSAETLKLLTPAIILMMPVLVLKFVTSDWQTAITYQNDEANIYYEKDLL